MSEIPEAELRVIAQELRDTQNAPHGIPTYDWRYTEEEGNRVRVRPGENGDTGEGRTDPMLVTIDFDDGPRCLFTHAGIEYEAAWRRWYQVVAYRVAR